MLSEEAQEVSDKVYRLQRRLHARKMSRAVTNEDVFRNTLAHSDPFSNIFRKDAKTDIATLD